MNNSKITYVSDFAALSSFFLMILQSCFLTLFQGQGWVACALILLINIRNLKNLFNVVLSTSLKFFFFIFWLFMIIKDIPFQWIIYMTFVFLATIIFLLNYINTNRSFINDLYKFLTFVFYYSIAHVIVLLLFDQYFQPATLISGIRPHTFLYLFFYNYSQLDGFFRIQGFTWEPGNWQLFLNLFFYFSMIKNRNITVLLLVSVCIYFTHSTNGYILLIVNWAIYIYYSKYKTRIIPVIAGISMIVLPLFWTNIESKFSGDNQVSGLARIRDIEVGRLLITKYPFIGTNPETINMIPEVRMLKEKMFYDKMGNSANDANTAGFVEDGFLNGLLQVFLDWGLIMAIIIYICYCRSPLLNDKRTMLFFSFIVFLSMTAEPISRTIFFYIFPFSTLIMKSNIKAYSNGENFNNNSDVQCREDVARMLR